MNCFLSLLGPGDGLMGTSKRTVSTLGPSKRKAGDRKSGGPEASFFLVWEHGNHLLPMGTKALPLPLGAAGQHQLG